MKMLFLKQTPFSVVCILSFIYLVVQIFITHKDKNILAFIVIFIIFLFMIFVLDRFLVSKVDYKKLFVIELVFMGVGTIWYLYANRTTRINIETSKDYFFVVYANEGLNEEAIPTKGLFNKEIVINADSNVHINRELEYNAQLNPPKAWNYSFSAKKQEATIGAEKITVEIYSRKLNEQETDAELRKEILRLQKLKE